MKTRKCQGSACDCGREGSPEDYGYHLILGLTGDQTPKSVNFHTRAFWKMDSSGVINSSEALASASSLAAERRNRPAPPSTLPLTSLISLAAPAVAAWVAFQAALPAPSVCLPAGEPAARPDAPRAPSSGLLCPAGRSLAAA